MLDHLLSVMCHSLLQRHLLLHGLLLHCLLNIFLDCLLGIGNLLNCLLDWLLGIGNLLNCLLDSFLNSICLFMSIEFSSIVLSGCLHLASDFFLFLSEHFHCVSEFLTDLNESWSTLAWLPLSFMLISLNLFVIVSILALDISKGIFHPV